MISLILAMDNDRVIGNKGQLPWHIPSDLKHFKETTLGKTVIMGRKTYDSIGKPLPNRKNIVITSKASIEGVEVSNNIDALLNKYKNSEEEIFVIGGASIYNTALPYASKIVLSLIPGKHEGDAYMEKFEDDFELVSEENREEFVLKKYRRK